MARAEPSWLYQTSLRRQWLMPATITRVPWTATLPWWARPIHCGAGRLCHDAPWSTLAQTSRRTRWLQATPPVSTSAPPTTVTLCAQRAGQGGFGSSCQLSPWSSLRQTSCVARQAFGPSPTGPSFPPMMNTDPPTAAAARPPRQLHGGRGSCRQVLPWSVLLQTSLWRSPPATAPPRTSSAPCTATAAWKAEGRHAGVGSCCHVLPWSQLDHTSLRNSASVLPPSTKTCLSLSTTAACSRRAGHGGSRNAFHVAPRSSLLQAPRTGSEGVHTEWGSVAKPPSMRMDPCTDTHESQEIAGQGGGVLVERCQPSMGSPCMVGRRPVAEVCTSL
mmetsp:Transcript_100299/g.323653  ORF Transcript_100299/g.323653 Transcript_100299/m.323653 type:complete len:332 (-) Transcript_100299:12-1007(-)